MKQKSKHFFDYNFNVVIRIKGGNSNGYCMNSYAHDLKSYCMQFIKDEKLTLNSLCNPPRDVVIAELCDNTNQTIDEIVIYKPFVKEANHA